MKKSEEVSAKKSRPPTLTAVPDKECKIALRKIGYVKQE
jgi:hypothetical protein